MLSPRWQKVMRELWRNRLRTLLVVLSIAVGVTAIGAVATTYTIVTRDLPANYARVNPADIKLFAEPFDEGLVQVVRDVPGVAAAEGRRVVNVRLQVRQNAPTSDGQARPPVWRDLQLFAVADYDDIQIAKIWPEAGDWPADERELLIERAALAQTGARVGDSVLVEAPNGTQRQLTISGLVHDLNQPSARFVNSIYGYVTFETLAWLGLEDTLNQLDIVVSDAALGVPGEAPSETGQAALSQVAADVRSKVEKSGREVFWVSIPEPGSFPFEQFIDPMAYLLAALGLLAVLLSGFLVINTISALLAQQIRQIGVMKAVGGRTNQIMGMYLVLVMALGLLALVLSVPLGLLVARQLVGLIAQLINFDIIRFQPPGWVFGLQMLAALAVPLLAALYPIRSGTRVTVREAINSYGLSEGSDGTSFLDHLLAAIRGLPRPTLISLRNTFRRKGRLVLTLLTLALGSMISVAVFSVQSSLTQTLDDAMKYWQYDVGVTFSRPYRVEEIEREALRVPGVVKAESWGYQGVRRLRPDGSNSDNIVMTAPPAETELLQPTILQGRWLLPEDENAVVVNTDLLRQEPDLRVGEEIVLDLDGRESSWLVVGVLRGVLSGPTVYANYPYFSRLVRSVDQASSVQVVTERHEPAFQRQVAQALEDSFEASSLRVSSVNTIAQLRATVISQFNVLVIFLLSMALLLALVGALGLMGTMSINVLERTREIGVMRAIGASGRTVQRMVILEGSLIGALSWIVGASLALPVSRLLSNTVGRSFLQSPLSYTFSAGGAVFWLLAVLLLAALASLWPARRASRLSVREVLAYE